jgi:hypothetical protein
MEQIANTSNYYVQRVDPKNMLTMALKFQLSDTYFFLPFELYELTLLEAFNAAIAKDLDIYQHPSNYCRSIRPCVSFDAPAVYGFVEYLNKVHLKIGAHLSLVLPKVIKTPEEQIERLVFNQRRCTTCSAGQLGRCVNRLVQFRYF